MRLAKTQNLLKKIHTIVSQPVTDLSFFLILLHWLLAGTAMRAAVATSERFTSL